ncbi:hypothetical protein TI39_contig572g00008 [Zymoseptoria brevis]|uniref:Uncharacterized protein n=1 Tax=Zymoseptoria brevis TaxID=1047168 RepID=A0A0F4GLI9_9PEZI|nr:hypothetical protein TI39_contig572g00008 [Zymoseptoria brevis]
MKSAIVFELAALAAVALCKSSEKDFKQLQFPDWVAGDRLFPANVIEGYHDDYNNQTAESWSIHVLERCRAFEAGTSTITYSAINSGTPKDRYWFGYCFRGGRTTVADYVLTDGVQDSIVYTI